MPNFIIKQTQSAKIYFFYEVAADDEKDAINQVVQRNCDTVGHYLGDISPLDAPTEIVISEDDFSYRNKK